MNKFWIWLSAIVLILVGLAAVVTTVCEDDWCNIFPWQKQSVQGVNFETCLKATGRVMESYPRQCAYKGQTYVEELAAPPPPVRQTPLQNLSISPNTIIVSPLSFTGEALGSWFFEASFPVKVLDANNTVLGTGLAQAQSDWMQTGYVPFNAGVTFTPSSTQTGFLVLEKDNPV